MGNIYTEQENTWAAQISNCLITDLQIQWAIEKFDLAAGEPPTFKQIVLACEERGHNLWFREMEGDEPQFFEDAKTEYFGNWKIVGIYDDNDNSGFYAVAIETGEYTTNNVENGVIFSARGTEPILWEQFYLDLVNTDLNIFNSDVTEQELVMYDFLDNEFATLLEEKGYSNLATTGHSLGGYLSFSAAGHIMVKGEHASEIFMQGTNIDGPGVTEENLEVNADTYAKLDPYLTHYHYTYIGGLLNPICSNYVSITGASDVSAYVEELPLGWQGFLASHLGPEVADDINILYGYYKGHTGKHALASLQFVGGNGEDAGNFDTSYVENHKYFEVNDLISSCVVKGDIFGLLSNVAVLFITLQLYYESENYDAGSEFDLWANIVDRAAQIADDNDLIQIFAGGVIKMTTELINDVVDMSDEYEQLRESIKLQLAETTPALASFTTDIVVLLSDPTIDAEQWFDLVDDVVTLSNSLDIAPIVRDGKIVAEQCIDTICNFSFNLSGFNLTVADELGLVDKVADYTYGVQKEIMESTANIIHNVESWDSATKYLNAQKTLTLNCVNHVKELENLSADFKDDTSALYSDYVAYTESTMNWVNTMVKYYVGNNSGVTQEDLQKALVTVNNTTEKLLLDYVSLYEGGTGIIVEVGSTMKDFIIDSFQLVHAWGEKEISDVILTAGNNLYNNLKDVNVADLISDWVITVKDQFNDATEYVYGLTGGIEIRGTDKDDVINGNSGDCTLYGKGGNDTLIGGRGDDRLEGAEGADTYIFNLGDGADTIYDYEWAMGNVDKIAFGSGISAEDVIMERNGNDLVVKYSANDSFTIKDAYHDNYGTGRYFVECIQFANGTIWGNEEIANRANIQVGTEGDDVQSGYYEAVGYHQGETFHMLGGNDTVNAGEGNDTIYGDEGDDTLYGENGNDTLIGGTGNDYMTGDAGADSFVFNLGDGTDTVYDHEWDMGNVDKIVFGSGISAEDVIMERNGNDLVVKYSENDSFTVKHAYHDNYGTGRYFVEQVEFADGTVWDTEEIANRANIQVGTEGDDEQNGYYEAVGYHQGETYHMLGGNDTVTAGEGNDTIHGDEGDDSLHGESGNDTLIGGRGNDYMTGDAGADSFVFNLGDGTDTVYDHEWDMGNVDKIVFGEGIQASDVVMERNGNNLVVKYSANDSFTVLDAYRDNYGTGRYFVEQVEFSDGTVWDTEEIANRANIQVGTEGDDEQNGYYEAVGYHQGETFHMLGGNDTVTAGEGNDTIHGDEGDDSLHGENGNDTLIGGRGNDYVVGGADSDSFVFNLGDGTDTVYDHEWDMGNVDKIVFGEGIKASDVVMERNGNNLVVKYSANDSFTVLDAYRDNYGTGRYFVEQVEFADGTVWDTEEIANRANIQVGTEGDDEQTGYYEAVGYHQGETFHMLGGNDTVSAGEGNDTIYGDEGDDTLYGHNGNDTLIGGTGNDYMTGDAGADSFVFNLGDGTDTVYDHEWDMGNIDKIVFGYGISAEDVIMERNGNDLVVKYSENDSFTVKHAYHDNYGTGRYFVEQVEFADGTVWDTEEIANRANIQVGTEGDDEQNGYYEAVGYHQGETFHMLGGNDTVNAGEGNDTVYGDEGDDTLYGHNGNDTLIGGTGNDYMTGDAGADSFVFNIGDGTDTVYDHEWDMGNVDKIVFGEGIQASDVVMERNGNNLVVKYSANDSFTVLDAYHDNYGTGRYFVEQVEFSDGTVWDTEEIANRANIQVGTEGDDEQTGYYEAVGYHQGETFHMLGGNDTVNAGEGNDTVYGDEGNDTLYGHNGNDTLIGGRGNDYMTGDAGADSFVFNIGDGTDTVYDHEWDMGNVDKIVFGSGISAEDVIMERNGNDLVVKYSENDSFTVKHAYHDNYGTGRYFVEQVEFADGTVWDTEEIANRANIQVGTEGDDEQNGYYEAVGYHQGETYHMLGGNDTVQAGEGNDTVYGDAGNDTLYGQNGNDTLVGGTGNDYMTGDAGADSFVFNLGDGTDTVYDHEWDMGNVDKIVFGEGIQASDVVMERNGNDLVVKYSENDSFTVKHAYHDNYGTGRYFVEQMEFADGTVWDTEEIANRANIQVGTEENDVQYGYGEAVGYHHGETYHMLGGNDLVGAGDGDDTVYGDEGDDTLHGDNGDDTVIGGTGNDYVTGGEGADTLIGGAGNDTLAGGNGEDVYRIGAEDGDDVINNYDSTGSRLNDKIVYGEGVLVDDISITRSGNDLLISNAKTQQTTVIAGAYSHEYNQLYNLEFYDEDTAVIDYSTTSLNITYAVKEEIAETETEEVIENEVLVVEPVETELPEELTEESSGDELTEEVLAEELAMEEIPEIVESAEAVTETQEAVSDVADDSAVIVSEEDITKMTGLVVQEMAGADADGIPQIVNPDANVVAESDSLLWVE